MKVDTVLQKHTLATGWHCDEVQNLRKLGMKTLNTEQFHFKKSGFEKAPTAENISQEY